MEAKVTLSQSPIVELSRAIFFDRALPSRARELVGHLPEARLAVRRGRGQDALLRGLDYRAAREALGAARLFGCLARVVCRGRSDQAPHTAGSRGAGAERRHLHLGMLPREAQACPPASVARRGERGAAVKARTAQGDADKKRRPSKS